MTKTPLLALVLLPALALAQSPMESARKVAAEYRAATLKKDFASFDRSSTKDFVYIDAKGQKAEKAQALAGMKAFYGPLIIKSLSVKAVSAKMAEGGLVYIQDTKMVGVSKMLGPKPATFASDSRDEVLVVKQGDRWLTKRVRNLRSVDTLDGKPMKM